MKSGAVSFILTIALIVAVAAVYYGSLHAPFIYDDYDAIVKNETIQQLSPLSVPLTPPRNTPMAGRPLVNLTFALNYHFDKLNPTGYRIVNIVIHIISCLLLWQIVRATLRCDALKAVFPDRISEYLSFAVAFVWGLHPLQTESVIYVTQRTELLAGFWYLTVLLCAIRFRATENSPLQRAAWLILAGAAGWAGAACKEIMVTAPLMVLLYERTFVYGSFFQALRSSTALYGVLFSNWIPVLALNYDGPRSASAGFNLGVPVLSWWFTQAKVLMIYLKLAVWPHPLMIHYDMPYLASLKEAFPWIVPSMMLAVGVLVLLLKRRPSGFLGAWVLLILSPTLLIPIPTEIAAERRLYLPLAAIVAFVVIGLARLIPALSRWVPGHDRQVALGRLQRAGAGILLALVVMLGVFSVKRTTIYRDDLTLWQDVIGKNPDDAVAHNNLGYVLYNRGQIDEAVVSIRKALQLKPDLDMANYNLAQCFERTGDSASAQTYYWLAVAANSYSVEARNNLAVHLANAGRFREAFELFAAALKIKPNAPVTRNNLRSLREVARLGNDTGLTAQIDDVLGKAVLPH